MHIGVNTLFLIPREVGGTEIYVRSLLPALLALQPQPRLTVFTNRENHDTFDAYDRVLIDVAAVSRPRRVLAEQFLLPRAAARAKVGVLYSPGYTAPLRAPCPQVVTIHDTQFLDFPQDFPWLSRTAQRVIVGGAAQRAGAVTTVSEFSRGRIAEQLGVPREKIVVAHSALSGLFAQPQPCALPRPFLLYISNTYPHKNAARLVRAFDQIKDRIPHAMVICGQPREGEPPSHPRVMRIHYVSYEELIGMVQAADLMVFPSLYEGFGRPVVEAQEAGTRVIASHAAAIPEIGGDGATYFDGESEDSIAQAILGALNESPETRRAYIACGRRNARRFTWGACAQRTLQACEMARSAQAVSPFAAPPPHSE